MTFVCIVKRRSLKHIIFCRKVVYYLCTEYIPSYIPIDILYQVMLRTHCADVKDLFFNPNFTNAVDVKKIR